jgi:DNA modification methylase
MTYELHHHNALHVSEVLEPASVDLIVTSPPYFALRSYRDDGEHFPEQIGSEASPSEFVDALIACTADWLTVLRPGGSLFVNLGDKYAGSGGHNNASLAARRNAPDRYNQSSDGIRAKSLMGLPWRYALRCIDELGLILRAEIIWSKPNGLPESVTDRVRRSHEQWFHLVQRPQYFAAIDEVREESVTGERQMYQTLRRGAGRAEFNVRGPSDLADGIVANNPLGKVPSSVWTIPATTTARTVLESVAAGALTPQEGERILWSIASNGSSSTSTPTSPAAGNGAGTATPPAMDAQRPSSFPDRNSSHTAPHTSCSSDPSPTDSTSTTSAATGDVSTLTTSKPSPNRRTTVDSSPSSRTAPTGTATTTPTATTDPAAPTASAAHVNASGHGSDITQSVWNVPSEPLTVPDHLGVDHFAAFPSELVRRLILGWTPSGYCTACDEPRQAVVDKRYDTEGRTTNGPQSIERRHESPGREVRAVEQATITGYRCACPDTTAPTRHAVVLDPFAGTGTVPMVAHHLGRHGIGIDLSKDYLRLAEWRCSSDYRARTKVRTRSGIPDPVPAAPGQLDLFDDGVTS